MSLASKLVFQKERRPIGGVGGGGGGGGEGGGGGGGGGGFEAFCTNISVLTALYM